MKHTTIEPLLYRMPEAADLLGVSTRQIYLWFAAGEMTPIKLGRAVRLPRSEIDRFLAARYAESGIAPIEQQSAQVA